MSHRTGHASTTPYPEGLGSYLIDNIDRPINIRIQHQPTVVTDVKAAIFPIGRLATPTLRTGLRGVGFRDFMVLNAIELTFAG
jgi:hypothetical protein